LQSSNIDFIHRLFTIHEGMRGGNLWVSCESSVDDRCSSRMVDFVLPVMSGINYPKA
jgi:hypothetical protein